MRRRDQVRSRWRGRVKVLPTGALLVYLLEGRNLTGAALHCRLESEVWVALRRQQGPW